MRLNVRTLAFKLIPSLLAYPTQQRCQSTYRSREGLAVIDVAVATAINYAQTVTLGAVAVVNLNRWVRSIGTRV
jgi:hypothetical protein